MGIINAKVFKEINEEKLNVSNADSDISLNNLYYMKNGNPWYIVSGEFHYARYACEKWADEIAKIKAGGVNVITSYCFWNCHEPVRKEYNFENDFNLKAFVHECKKQDMKVILRLGPWSHAELKYGGLPDFIERYKKHRTNDKKYLEVVKQLFAQYYDQVKDDLYPNGAVIGIQLENEYKGDFSHIKALKDIAEEVGFKVPMFTATAWPKTVDENEVIPMYGRYPEAPWNDGIKPIPTDDRFDCIPIATNNNIGNDLIKVVEESSYSKTPISFCELGPGNQVSNHRRPIISTMDVYAITLSTLSKGTNLLGYYMYHGGRNPNFTNIQESKATGYPNDMPVISYDFQAPLGEYGYPKDSYFYIRLLHYLARYYDKDFALKQPFYPDKKTGDESSYNVRMDNDKSGYCFVTTYKRLISNDKQYEFDIVVDCEDKQIILPKISLPIKECFVYPFNFKLGDQLVNYITAQPFLRYEDEKGVHLMYFKHPNVDPIIRLNNHRYLMRCENKPAFIIESLGKKYIIELYDREYASKIYFDGNKPQYSDNFIYEDSNKKLVEIVNSKIDNEKVILEAATLKKMPYDKDLYDEYKPQAFELSVDLDTLKEHNDIKVAFKSNCDKAHIYIDDKIVADYMLYNGDFEICLDRFRDELMEGKKLYIKTSAVKKGAKVYYEIPVVPNDSNMEIKEVIAIDKK